ncbi:hypothetical protein SDC9_79640 [bioreactor metagenome]|uniref:Uncharacterized protein n=1 Tax=bioreactor metagenome TaxID=1076179 RepID=A0A644Z2V7_9ZZZZ
MGIGGDTNHASPLLVHTDEQGNSCGLLIAANGLNQVVGGFVLCVPAKENIAAQMVIGHVRQPVRLRDPGEKQLTHLFLKGHLSQQGVYLRLFFVHGRGSWFLGRGAGPGGVGRVRDRSAGRRTAACGQGKQAGCRQQRAQQAFHKSSRAVYRAPGELIPPASPGRYAAHPTAFA